MKASSAATLEPLSPVPSAEVEYRSSDGGARAESGWQGVAMVPAREGLDRCFRECDDLYAGIAMLVYYEQGDCQARLAPNVFAAFDVEAMQRENSQANWWMDRGWCARLTGQEQEVVQRD